MVTDGDAGKASGGGGADATPQGAEKHRVVDSAAAGGPDGGAGAPPGGSAEPPGNAGAFPTWHDVYEVSSYWADMTGHAYPHGILEMMQDSAWRHAEALGFGYTDLGQESLLWVLSRLDVDITRMPRWGETVRLETWPTGTHRLFALREYCLYDDDERELLRANSAWLVLDGESRKPRKPGPVVEGRNIPLNPGNYDEAPGKIAPPDENTTDRYELRVRYSDIDAQRHVNNARYVEWMLNGLPDDWMDTYWPRRLSVNFLRECVAGDEIAIRTGREDDEHQQRTSHSVMGVKQPVCLMNGLWAAR